MKKTIFSVFAAAAFLILIPANSLACTCLVASPAIPLRNQVGSARNESRAVFSGKVIEITEDPQDYKLVVKLKLERAWKGSLRKEVSIVTGRGGGDCGYNFKVGERYLVYASGQNDSSLTTNICQRTAKLLDAAKDVKILGKGKVVKR